MEGFLIYMEDVIRMPRARGSQPHNAAGWLRSAPFYFAELLLRHPEFFSVANRLLIAIGKSPIVDLQWIDHHLGHSRFLGQLLDHHHLGRGSRAAAIPSGAHVGPGAHKLNHY
jgi:hypothetical protein